MSANPISGATPTLRNEIEFFRANGFMRHPIQGGENEPPAPEPKPDPEEFPEGLGDKGKEALKAERDARKTAEKARADADKELAQLRKEKQDAANAKAQADEEEAKRKGEFETLAEKRKQEADEARADAESKGKKIERAESVLRNVVAARVKELEALDDKDLIAAFPKDAEPLEQLEWLDDPRTKAAMRTAATAKADAEAQKKRVPGGVTPRPNGDPKRDGDDAAKKAQSRHMANEF